ncbi:MAG TPA: SIR2 family protein [Sphingomicrobium sp.]|nr:SIR2 family protein [Sphingomicrobium sp.]
MQFIPGGPDVPDRLLQAHEEGEVVFFCGAGISFPADLPSFKGLVKNLYSSLGTVPTDVENAAIKKWQYDTAIALLEDRYPGGREKVREHVAQLLTPTNLTHPRATTTHRALLNLARARDGRHRLITTNFDRLFETVSSGTIRHSAAPRLPVPKQKWNGLVYLHGLLPEAPTANDLDTLVLSSGDFGLAYLTERWASRFVSELVRNYTVCFVGYSINDPVLRYMMDALAADRLLGEAPREVFAFGSFSKGQENQQATEWGAKHVTPILYREHAKHFYLHRTLEAWASHYRDGITGNERIVAVHCSNPPAGSTIQDDFIGRVLWALSDPSGLPAKKFAELDPAPPLEWLEPLGEYRFKHDHLRRFGIQPEIKKDDKLRFSLLERYVMYDTARSMQLVDVSTDLWDTVMFQLARWLVRHLNDPALYLWFASRGGKLAPQLVNLISLALSDSTAIPVSPAMRTLWSIMLAGRVR